MSDSTDYIRKNILRLLPCVVTDEQTLFYARAAAKQRRERDKLQEEAKAEADKRKQRITELDAEIDRLDGIVASGREDKHVICHERFHAGMVELVREDTLEVVDVRTPSEAELQVVMPGVGEGGLLQEAERRQAAGDDEPGGEGDDEPALRDEIAEAEGARPRRGGRRKH